MAIATSGRLEATQQLDRVLRGQQGAKPGGRSAGSVALGIAGLIVLGIAAGGALAWMTAPPSLLGPATAADLKVKRMPTVRQQYDLARMASIDREQHWLAVERYFPPEKSTENLYYARLARRGRANLYVAERRLPEALKLYEQLAKVEEAEIDLQLSGLAGEAVVFHRFMETETDRHVLELLNQEVAWRLVRLQGEANLDQRISAFLAKEVHQLIEEYQQRGES